MDDQSRDPDSTIAHIGPAPASGPTVQIAQYRILKQLGRGGFGVVYQAEDIQLHRLAALKVMRPDHAAHDESRARFIREAQAAAALKHDHIVTIYQVGEEKGVPFLAMELLAGKSLDEWLRPDRRATVAETLLISKQIARGLAAAHAAGLVHRDIKPANLWLEAPRGRVKILDFGLARLAANYTQLTEDGSILGTPAFMAPEQARGGSVDHRCDLFSVGCVLYRMLTGRLPFQGETTYAVLTAIASETPQPAIRIRSEIPQRISDLVDRLLAKNPNDRVQSAQEVFDELTSIEKELNPLPLPPPLVAAVAKRPPRVWWTLGLTAAAVLVLSMTIAPWMRTSSETVEPKLQAVDSPETASPTKVTETMKPNPARLEPLRELNTPGEEFAASLSFRGHVMFFTRVSKNQSESGTFRAARRTMDVPFGKQDYVLRLRQSVESRSSLIGVARSRESGTILFEARRDGRGKFAKPEVIPELENQSMPRSPWVSPDGLTLVFQRHDGKGDYPGSAAGESNVHSEFVMTTRTSPSDVWSEPVRLPLNDDPLYSEPLSWPALTEDLLTLFFCIGDGKSAKVVYATRPSSNRPFANPRVVIVEGKPLLGRTPHYEPQTRELFVARDLSTVDKPENWDLWVVKDFSLDPVSD